MYRPDGDEGERPWIAIDGDPLPVIQGITSELVAQWDRKTLFDRGDAISRLVPARDSKPAHMEQLDDGDFLSLLQETARMGTWGKNDEGVWVFNDCWPDPRTVKAISSGHGKFSPLTGLARTPFLRADGSVCQTPGYDPESRMLLVPDASLGTLNIPDRPTRGDAEMARVFVLKVWMGDWPFPEEADRANALALALTPIIRDLVPLVPLAAVNGLQQGVGKNKFSDCIHIVGTGMRQSVMPYTRNDEEQRKVITSAFQRGDSMFIFDEAHTVEGGSFARAITSPNYSDRVLGGNKMPSYPNKVTWISLGNHVKVIGDMARRVYPIHMWTPDPNPQDRSIDDFNIKYPEAWTEEHRAEMVEALLTMVRAWVVAGRPEPSRRASFGSFEPWERMVGGIIEFAGQGGFLENRLQFRSESDTSNVYWAEHLLWLEDAFGVGDAFTVKDAVAAMTKTGADPEYPPGLVDAGEPGSVGFNRKLGEAYQGQHDRWHGELKLVKEEGKAQGKRSKFHLARFGAPRLSVPPDTHPLQDPSGSNPEGQGGSGGSTTPFTYTEKNVLNTGPSTKDVFPRIGEAAPLPPGPSATLPAAPQGVVLDIETGSAKALDARYSDAPFFRVGGLTEDGVYRSTTSAKDLALAIAGSKITVGHNAIAFDLAVLDREAPDTFDLLAMTRERRVLDTMVLDALRNPPEPGTKPGQAAKEYSLNASCRRHRVPGKVDDLKAVAKEHGGFDKIPVDDPTYLEYVEGDVQAARALGLTMERKAPISEYEWREMRVAAIASTMTARGLGVDEALLQRRFWQSFSRRRDLARRLHAEHGLPLTNQEGKASGNPSFGRDGMEWVLEEYPANAELCELAESLKDIAGVRTVYGTALEYLAPDLRVHPDVLMLQASGRWSVTHPGMTVYGKRGGRVIERAVFTAAPGHVLIAADLSQVDARAVAVHSQDHAYLDLFEPGIDSHIEVAKRVWGDPDRRHDAKAIGHGWNYGMGLGKLVRTAGVDVKVAAAFDRTMRKEFPRLVEWQNEVRAEVKGGNRLDNGFGRIMRPSPHRAHTQAPALMGQGTARDLMMECLLRLPDDVVRMLRVQVHDEIVLEVPEADEAEVRAALHEAMHFEWAPPGVSRPVPIIAQSGPAGRNWAGCY